MVTRIFILLAFGVVVTGCNSSAQAPNQKPSLSAEQQAQKAEAAKKAERDMRIDQINRSNLPANQKQALVNQIRSSAGK